MDNDDDDDDDDLSSEQSATNSIHFKFLTKIIK